MSEQSCILVVEDDENDVFLFDLALEKAEINCLLHRVQDGEAAIRYLGGMGPYADRTKYPMPNLMILDLKLPLVDGFGVLSW